MLDAMRAELRALGVISYNDHGGDPVSHFFASLPSPEEHHSKSWFQLSPIVQRVAARFLAQAGRAARTDAEFQLVKTAAEASYGNFAKGAAAVYDHLAAYALSTDIDPADQSTNATQLRYIRWVAEGRNDASSPFGLPDTGEPILRCAGCGATSETSQLRGCTGCRLTVGDTLNEGPFTAWYCGKACQARNWSHHKQGCREARALVRAVSMFNEIFRHFLTITYHSRFTIKSISVVQGLVVAATDPVSSGPEYTVGTVEEGDGFSSTTLTFSPAPDHTTKWSRFPLALANDENTALAVLMHTYCNAPANEARSLLEALIRRKSSPQDIAPRSASIILTLL